MRQHTDGITTKGGANFETSVVSGIEMWRLI